MNNIITRIAHFVIVNIHGALQALKLFIRFAIAKGVVTYGMRLMLAFLSIIQGIINTIMNAAGFGTPADTDWIEVTEQIV